MSRRTLFDKVWQQHRVSQLETGQTQLLIGLHLIHEVTSPQAFAMLRKAGLKVACPQQTLATVDHIVPTDDQRRPFVDPLAEEMLKELEQNTASNEIRLYNLGSGRQGVVHIIAPELGLTQPGMTIACGDSHTATHGAFGAVAFGIGTSQVRDVLATQTLAMDPLKVRRIEIDGTLASGVYAKDIILHIIRHLGVKGGVGYAYEFAGSCIDALDMEARMTICNMAIEGGARCGYINPDQTTFDYLRDREFAPKEAHWQKALAWWRSIASDADAEYDDLVKFRAEEISPTLTWGITPGQALGLDETLPQLESYPDSEQDLVREAYQYMALEPGQSLLGLPIDVVFIGSCTNGRISDLREVARICRLHGGRVPARVKALIVPGSEAVKAQAEAEGLDKVFVAHGFAWRNAGCSMCLAMNPDRLEGRQICASTSNRNFKGRQGSPAGRTLLMSPALAALTALEGQISDPRPLLRQEKIS